MPREQPSGSEFIPDALPPPDAVPSDAALFLDLDGTLAAFAQRPEEVGPDRRRSAVLRDLASRLDGRLAVLSGRSLSEIDRILSGAVDLAAGVHGLERRLPDGSVQAAERHPALSDVLCEFEALARERSGVLVEDKGLSVGVHYRLDPEARDLVRTRAAELADRHGLALQPGDMVVELKTPGSDKGAALRAFMAEPPFAGRTPVFVGDDLTDEDGFRAAAELGGYGVLVGPARPTAASTRLDSVDAVLDWLERCARPEPVE